MTAHFALPATTAVLQGILTRRIQTVYGSLPAPAVLAEPPPRPPGGPAQSNGSPPPETSALYLYLHHAGPNPAWRNTYEPHVSGTTGLRSGRAPLALDLHYLLAATGATLEREVLLGTGIHALTRNAIVPRSMVHTILTSTTIPSAPTKLIESLPGEPLDDPASQPEQITIAQTPVDIDMSTKIWSALQAPMRPCAYFLVTTVFLDMEETFAPAKDVETVHVEGHPSVDRAAGTGP